MRCALAAILLACGALVPGTVRAVEQAEVTVRIGGGRVRVASGAAVAEVARGRFRLRLRADGRTLVREQRPGLFYERSGTNVDLLEVEAATTLPDGVRL